MKTPEICIIGAGMSGLLLGIRLKQAGIDSFRIFEKAPSLGGTWRENRYPGLTCDVPSTFYCYSFEPNPDWSQRFSSGREILAYFENVARKHDLLPRITFDSRVTSVRRAGGRWQVETHGGDAGRGGERFEADVVVKATGPLHAWRMPEIAGLESFAGAAFHSADWQHDVELRGKRIGVVGNGSSGVQMMAPLSELASHLVMFQRTAQWILPMGNHEYTPEQRERARRYPILPKLARLYYKQIYETFSEGVVRPGLKRRFVSNQCRRYLASVKDPELRAKLTPTYEPMCKRLVLSNTFYPTLMKPHVELVTERIDRVEARGVVTADGVLHELDVLVLATGFDTHAWGVDSVVRADGVSLAEAWARGRRAYRSVAMPGFPNFFMMVGPNSPIGNISVIDVAEVQAEYILQCLQLLWRNPGKTMAPTPEATAAFHDSVKQAMKDTVWVTGCNSWYLDAEGVPNTWPWPARRFHRDMRKPRRADFELGTA